MVGERERATTFEEHFADEERNVACCRIGARRGVNLEEAVDASHVQQNVLEATMGFLQKNNVATSEKSLEATNSFAPEAI